MNELVEKFLYKVLGGKDIDKVNDLDDLVMISIRKAYKDMLIGGRYVGASLSEPKLSEIQKLIKDHEYTFCREMIDEAAEIISKDEIISGSGSRYATRFGLAQKLINMTYKYLYVFNDFRPRPELSEAFKQCDCPLDSVILNTDHLKSKGLSNFAWTKLKKEDYIKIQDAISEKCEDRSIGNLQYDFKNW